MTNMNNMRFYHDSQQVEGENQEEEEKEEENKKKKKRRRKRRTTTRKNKSWGRGGGTNVTKRLGLLHLHKVLCFEHQQFVKQTHGLATTRSLWNKEEVKTHT